jgi:phage protein D
MAKRFAPAFQVTVNGSALAADVSKNIVDVSVTSAPDALDQCSLTLANPYPELPWTHGQKAELFREGNALKVDIGYVDELQSIFSGEITSISPSFPASGMPTVGIEGLNRLYRLRRKSTTRTFEKVTDSEIARQIAREAELSAEVENTRIKHDYVMQHNETDLEFLRRRGRAIRFELFVQDRTLVFRKARDGQEKTYTLVWGDPQRSFDPTDRVLPLRSFAPTMNALRPLDQVRVLGTDPRTRKPIEGRAGLGDEVAKPRAGSTGPAVTSRAFGPRSRTLVDYPVQTQDEADEVARAIFNDEALEFLRGRGEALGAPDLRAGDVVELAGLGRYSGAYYVTEATHSIGAGGYTTHLALRSGGVR